LRIAVQTVLQDARYSAAAQHLQREIQKSDGLEIAARTIEETLGLEALAVAAD